MHKSTKGVILINLGTPDSSDPKSVYSYLKAFLNDPRVIDLPKVIRYILVNWLIIPLRYKKSAHAYQQIWSDNGSPLLVNSQELLHAVRDKCGDHIQIELGMRYGNPSIEHAFNKLKACQTIQIIPLFPQYSSAATGSAIAELLRVVGKGWNIPALNIQRDFFNMPEFIQAYTAIIKQHLQGYDIDKIIFSYHGLPERHLDKSSCHTPCTRLEPCPPIDSTNQYCYRAQCYATTNLIAKELNLNRNEYVVAFQSRLGKTPWIKPYTDLVLEELSQHNIKNIAIVCPAFVADCLETLEEINIRAREQWRELGGKNFVFIPCLNKHPTWVNGIVRLIN